MCIDFRERGMERKSEKHQRERETSIGCLLHEPQTGNNLGLCPDHELNAQPFGVWDNAPNNWATLPVLMNAFLIINVNDLLRLGYFNRAMFSLKCKYCISCPMQLITLCLGNLP